MRKTFLAMVLLPGLHAGSVAMAEDIPRAFFSGALSFDSPIVSEIAPLQDTGLSAGGFDLYRNEIGPLGMSIGTGLAQGVEEDPVGYRIGLRFDYGGLAVASQWRDGDTGVCGLAEGFCDAGPAWNIGASYSAGATSLSAQYQAVNPLGTEGQGLGGDVYRLGLDYRIFDGFSSRADAYFIDGDNGLSEGDSTVVLIGTRITF